MVFLFWALGLGFLSVVTEQSRQHAYIFVIVYNVNRVVRCRVTNNDKMSLWFIWYLLSNYKKDEKPLDRNNHALDDRTLYWSVTRSSTFRGHVQPFVKEIPNHYLYLNEKKILWVRFLGIPNRHKMHLYKHTL